MAMLGHVHTMSHEPNLAQPQGRGSSPCPVCKQMRQRQSHKPRPVEVTQLRSIPQPYQLCHLCPMCHLCPLLGSSGWLNTNLFFILKKSWNHLLAKVRGHRGIMQDWAGAPLVFEGQGQNLLECSNSWAAHC